MFLTPNYLRFIKPLLEYPDTEILLHHTKRSNKRITLINRDSVRKKYRLTYRKLYAILWRLEFLTQLFELMVASDLL